MKKIFIMLAAPAIMFTACDKNIDPAGIFRGPVKKVHEGKAWTWVQIDSEGNPVRLAVTIDDAAMNSLPVGEHNHGGRTEHAGENNFDLLFHPKAGVAPFNHVWLNWNPIGHEPEMIYGLPHFDFHFYMTSIAERQATVDMTKMDNLPAAAYLPPTYISPMPGVPQMGRHWIDFTSPELDPVNPALFTQTFIYGSYDGKVTFYEPMITKAFLLSANNFERSIPQPAKVQTSGWYPTKMRIARHDGVTDVILENFVYRQAS